MYASGRFNTDDGIRRAAMRRLRHRNDEGWEVSIPMTVLGGLQSASMRAIASR